MAEPVEIDELLCYISWKLQVMTTNDLVNICVNSFTESNIVDSKVRLFTACGRGHGVEPPPNCIKYKRRQGDSRIENNVRDMITLFQELGANAPKFAAADMAAMPNPKVDSTDVPSLIKAISDLRLDVSALTKVVARQQDTINDLLKVISEKSPQQQTATYASVVGSSESASTKQPNVMKEGGSVFKVPLPPPVDNVGYKRRRKQFVGSKPPSGEAVNSKIAGIKQVKSAELFVTRLSPECEPDDIVEYISANLNLTPNVEKIENASNEHFSSFHISCECDDPKVFYNVNLWPQHVRFRRWYPPRKPRDDQNGLNG